MGTDFIIAFFWTVKVVKVGAVNKESENKNKIKPQGFRVCSATRQHPTGILYLPPRPRRRRHDAGGRRDE